MSKSVVVKALEWYNQPQLLQDSNYFHSLIMSKVFRYISVAFLASVIFSLLMISVVKAQYDSDGGTPGDVQGEEESFGINIKSGETATFFPGACEIIDSIKLKARNDLKGDIKVTSYGEENPTESDKSLGKKIVEYCGIDFVGFENGDVESSIFAIEGNKDRLEELDLKKENARFFQFIEEENKWEQLNTPEKSETDRSNFFETDSVDQYSYYALAEKTGGLSTATILIIICVFLVLLLLVLFLIISSLGRREEERESIR